MKEPGWVFPIVLFVFQILLLGLFGGYVDYDELYNYKEKSKGGIVTSKTHEPKKATEFYTSFQDVHVMIFIGFGFLMTFLKKYGFGAVSYNMLLSCVTIQWATLLNAWMRQRINYEVHPEHWPLHDDESKHNPSMIKIGLLDIMTADFTCAAVLITFGALLGKTTRLQLLIVCICECAFFAANENILVDFLKIRDSGGSILVHEFGAYFGLAVSAVIRNSGKSHELEESNYHSDLFAMVGSVFLWVFWPSFNSGPVGDDPELQRRAIVNTYFALCACVVTAFVASAAVEKKFRLNMIHIQNATIAGGVAVGTSADLLVKPWGAILIGMLAGVLSVLGYTYLTPLMSKKLKIHDTCGVHNLHGMPAVFAGICGAIAAATIKETKIYGAVKDGSRTLVQQGGFQFAAVCVSFAIAVVGGLITGLLIKCLNRPDEDLYNDDPEWLIPELHGEDMTGRLEKPNGEVVLQNTTAA